MKYREKVFTAEVESTLKEVCIGISEHYEIRFLEIGSDADYVHILVQSVPTLTKRELVTTIKSVTARKIFKKHPEVKNLLWGGHFWTNGYYANTVGSHGTEDVIQQYVQKQGKEYKKIYEKQLSMFDDML